MHALLEHKEHCRPEGQVTRIAADDRLTITCDAGESLSLAAPGASRLGVLSIQDLCSVAALGTTIQRGTT